MHILSTTHAHTHKWIYLTFKLEDDLFFHRIDISIEIVITVVAIFLAVFHSLLIIIVFFIIFFLFGLGYCLYLISPA